MIYLITGHKLKDRRLLCEALISQSQEKGIFGMDISEDMEKDRVRDLFKPYLSDTGDSDFQKNILFIEICNPDAVDAIARAFPDTTFMIGYVPSDIDDDEKFRRHEKRIMQAEDRCSFEDNIIAAHIVHNTTTKHMNDTVKVMIHERKLIDILSSIVIIAAYNGVFEYSRDNYDRIKIRTTFIDNTIHYVSPEYVAQFIANDSEALSAVLLTTLTVDDIIKNFFELLADEYKNK